MFIVLYLRGISSPLYQLLYSAVFNKISVAYFQCEIVETHNVNSLYSITVLRFIVQRPGHPVHCPLFCHPSTAKAHPCNNWNVFLTFSKSIIYTFCCTLACLGALLWFWLYLRKSQSRWTCREQGAIHTWTDTLQQGDY